MTDVLDKAKARRVLQERIRRAESAEKVDLTQLLFPQQLAFVEDPARLKAAVCGRRAGKTEGLAHLMLKEALTYKNSLIPYITLTTMQAKRNMWPALRRLDFRLKLGMKFNENDLTARLPNGSQIFIVGGSEANELERLRGGKYPGVVIDEAQAFGPFLEDVISEIILPATMDYQGWIALTGTPNAACAGYFYRATTGRVDEEVSVHHWTAFDNPNLVDRNGKPFFASWIAETKQKRRWTDDNPTYQREWAGKWVRDEDGLIYRVRPHNLISGLPEEVTDWSYILGLDLGFGDSTAFVVMAYSMDAAQVVAVESYKQSGLIPSVVAAHVERLRDRYDFDAIVADAGGLGKGYVEEMKQRFGLPIQSAEKTKKNAYIEHLNGDLHAGVLSIIEHENQALIGETNLLQWRADAPGKPQDLARREDPRFDNHLCDAFLYGYRYCRQWLFESEEAPPKAGTREYEDARAQSLEAHDEKSYAKAQQPWWETTDEDEADMSLEDD